MTDARNPERWLNDRRFLLLSDAAFRLHAIALMYAVSNRTDGRLTQQDFALLRGVDTDKVPELEEAGLLKWTRGKWLLTEFRDTQTSKNELDALDAHRRREREKKARQRAAAREAAAATESAVPGDGARDRSPGMPVGQMTVPGQAVTQQEPEEPAEDDLDEYFADLNSQGTDDIPLHIAS